MEIGSSFNPPWILPILLQSEFTFVFMESGIIVLFILQTTPLSIFQPNSHSWSLGKMLKMT